MKKEKSCGAVIYSFDSQNNIVYLVQHMRLGHISMCKGHVEGDETEKETALREIKEETGLDVDLDMNFRHKITYEPFPGIIKDVHFFVAYSKRQDAKDLHDDEVTYQEWLPYEKTYDILTHDSDKETLKEANIYIKKKLNII